MAMFPKYNPASAAATPDFIRAQMAKDRKRQEKNAQRSRNLRYAAEIYNTGMGERSPIADFLAGSSPNAGTAEQNTASMEALSNQGMDQNEILMSIFGGAYGPETEEEKARLRAEELRRDEARKGAGIWT